MPCLLLDFVFYSWTWLYVLRMLLGGWWWNWSILYRYWCTSIPCPCGILRLGGGHRCDNADFVPETDKPAFCPFSRLQKRCRWCFWLQNLILKFPDGLGWYWHNVFEPARAWSPEEQTVTLIVCRSMFFLLGYRCHTHILREGFVLSGSIHKA